MATKLSSLRVTAEMDVAQYVRAAAQKVTADEGMVGSAKAVGQSLAAVDAAASKTAPGITSLSRVWITGYGDAAKFEAAVRRVGQAMDRGMDSGRAAAALDGIYRKFGQVADAAGLARQGFVALAPVVSALNERYDATSALADRASAATKRLTEAQRAQAQINSSLGVKTDFGGTGRAADIVGYGNALDALRAKYVPLAAAQQQYRATLEEINQAAKVGALTEGERAAAVARTKDAFASHVVSLRGTTQANDNLAKSTGLAQHELVNFGRQAQDVFVSLASGQGVMTVLIQQGTQIFDIFASSRGTVGGFFSQIAPTLTRALPAIGAATVAIGALYAAFEVGSQKTDLSRSLLGAGGASGLTGGQLNALAVEAAKAADVTVSSSRLIAAEFVRLGAVASGNLPRLTQLTKEYSIVTGQDLKASAQELARALADPEKGAELLASKLGILDSATTRGIRTALSYNDTLRAQKLLMDGISQATDGAIESQTKWERLRAGAGKVFDATLQGAANLVVPDSNAERLLKLDERRAEIQRSIAAAQRTGRDTSGPQMMLNDINAQLRPLQELQRAEQGAAEARGRRTESAKVASAAEAVGMSATLKTSLGLELATRAVSTYEKAIADASEKRNELSRNGADGGRSMREIADLTIQIEQNKKGLEAAKNQLKDYQSVRNGLTVDEERAQRVQEAQSKSIGAVTVEQRQAAAADLARAQGYGTARGETQALAAEERARKDVLIEARREIENNVKASNDNIRTTQEQTQGIRLSGAAMAERARIMSAARSESEKTGQTPQIIFERMLREEIEKTTKAQTERARTAKDSASVMSGANAAALNRRLSSKQRADQQELLQVEQEINQLRAAGLITDANANKLLQERLSAKRQEQQASTEGAGIDYLNQQGLELDNLRKQRALVFETRDKRIEELEVMRATQYVREQGLSTETGVGKQIVDRARELGKEKQLTEDIYRIREQIRQAQDFAADSMKSFLSDLLTGTDGLTGALKNLGKGFLSASLDALISGKGPLAGLTGLASTTKDGQGGVLGLLTNGIQGIGKNVKDGAKEGVGSGLENLSASGSAGVLSGLGISGKDLAGGLTAIAGLAGAYGAGAAAGSYGQAVGGGALSGGMAGLALGGTSIGASLGGASVLGPIGLIAGAALGYMGQQAARQKAKEAREKEAQDNYKEAQPAIATMRSQLRGEAQDTLKNRIAETEAATRKLTDVMFFANKIDEATATYLDFMTYKTKALGDFGAAFDGLVVSLTDGLGPNSAFSQAKDNVKSTGDALKGFVADAEFVFGAGAPQVERARDAAKGHALSILDGSKSLSVVATRMEEIRGAGVALQTLLTELGMSATEAAAVIEQDTIAALDRLKGSFRTDLEGKVNDALGYGYINEIISLLKEMSTIKVDAATLGRDPGLVSAYFKASAQNIVDGAELTGDAFNRLVSAFPDLLGNVAEFTGGLKGVAREADIAARSLAYQDRLFAATNDSSTLPGQLAAYDRTAIREREEEIRRGGEAIRDLEAAQMAERLNIIQVFNEQVIDDQKRAAEEARSFWDRFTRQIREYTDGLRAGSSSPLSPQDRLAAAQSQFNAQYALAQGGDRDALNGITSYSGDLIEALKGYYASSTLFQSGFQDIITKLEALPDQVSDTMLIVNAVTEGAQSTADAIAVMQNALKLAVDSGSAQQIANALSSYFNRIDANTDNTISYSEMTAALGGMASQSQLYSMFTRLDSDNSGSLSRLELIKQATDGTTGAVNQQQQLLDAIRTFTQSTNTNAASIANAAEVQKASLAAINNGVSGQYQTLAAANTIASQQEFFLNKIRENLFSANSRFYSGGNSLPVQGYAAGGYTGPGGINQEAGIVHRGEIVWSQRDISRFGGIAAVEALRTNDSLRMPAMPVPIAGGQSNAALIAAIGRLEAKLAGLQSEMARNTNVTAAAGEHVAKRVDGVTAAVQDGARGLDLLAA